MGLQVGNGLQRQKNAPFYQSTRKNSYFYELDSTILQEVSNSPYLGLNFSHDLTWDVQIINTLKKASSILGLIRRNFHHCPASTRKAAYISLVRSILEYGATIWDPYTVTNINNLEKIQRQAAKFITRDYKSRDPGCVTRMLQDLSLPPLQQRRKNQRLIFMFKIVEGLVPAIPHYHFQPVGNKRRIIAKKFDNCETKNFVEHNQLRNSKCFVVCDSKTVIFKNSFFPKTIVEWNQLDEHLLTAPSLEAFRSRLQKSN